VAYLDSLPVHELGELLSELPSSRQEPLQLGVLMVALNERLPDAHKLLPPEWLADRQRLADHHATRRRAGAVAERRVAEALRAWATDGDPAADHQEHGDQEHGELPDRSRDWQGEERDSEGEEDFGDSWRTYRERADHIRQTYGWTVPEPPPRAEHWLPLGRDDDQEHDQPPDRSRRWSGEDRDARHDER
jgi:hypothetical protein